MEDALDKWTVVPEYPTGSGMALDVSDIVDAMHNYAEEYMHGIACQRSLHG